MTTLNPFDSIPQEIYFEIFQYATVPEIFDYQLLSRVFHQQLSNMLFWFKYFENLKYPFIRRGKRIHIKELWNQYNRRRVTVEFLKEPKPLFKRDYDEKNFKEISEKFINEHPHIGGDKIVLVHFNHPFNKNKICFSINSLRLRDNNMVQIGFSLLPHNKHKLKEYSVGYQEEYTDLYEICKTIIEYNLTLISSKTDDNNNNSLQRFSTDALDPEWCWNNCHFYTAEEKQVSLAVWLEGIPVLKVWNKDVITQNHEYGCFNTCHYELRTTTSEILGYNQNYRLPSIHNIKSICFDSKEDLITMCKALKGRNNPFSVFPKHFCGDHQNNNNNNNQTPCPLQIPKIQVVPVSDPEQRQKKRPRINR